MPQGLKELVFSRKNELLALARAHGVRRLFLFGSAARGDDRPDSDLDFLAAPGPDFNLLTWSALVCSLEEMLGRKADVVLYDALRPELKAAILREAIELK